MAASSQPHKNAVQTIAPHLSFLDSLAAGVLREYGADPLKLADVTILVPDRATGSMLKQAFVNQFGGKPGILPRIDAPGDMDDDALSLKIADHAVLSQALMDIPPAVSRLYRQLFLAGEILKMPGMAGSVQKAVKLGAELGRFLDDAQRNDVDLSKIDSLVPEDFRNEWERTAGFLRILTQTWPQHLQSLGMIDPEDHANVVIHIRAAHWAQNPPSEPVIAAGFSDTTPAMREMLKAVAAMPQGKIVLPGLDNGMDDDSWRVMGPVHPQFALRKITDAIGVSPRDVTDWQDVVPKTPQARANRVDRTNAARRKLLREAMRPAGTAEGWSGKGVANRKSAEKFTGGAIDAEALNGMDQIVCGSPQEEASVIALKMRETLETPGRTATLVTPDRNLARRVSARLRHWKIEVDDGAGKSLAETQVGLYLLAAARMGAEGWAPIPFLEAMKHPLATLGENKSAFRAKLARIEDLVLHGPRPEPGEKGMKKALSAVFNRAARRKDLDQNAVAAEKKSLEETVTRIAEAGRAFFALAADPRPQPFAKYLDAHIRFAENMAASVNAVGQPETGDKRVWRGDEGAQVVRFLLQMREAAQHVPDVDARGYADVMQGLMRDVTLNKPGRQHPYLRILTPKQALFDKSDTVILGGLNDETWPPRPAENPWLSGKMLETLGLPAPDETIGASAAQFVQAASCPNALLTRSVRAGDAPAVASPFLTRLSMVLKGAGLDGALEGKSKLLDIHTALHTPAEVAPVEPPMPTPPADLRPKQLPVTAIEGMMRDPYSVYARYVLKLRPKSAIDAGPGLAERGIFTHAALETFVKKYPDDLPENAYDELLRIGREAFETRMDSTIVEAFWWPRFERVAKWFVKFETERRDMCRTLGTEVRGRLEIDLGGETFVLTAIADRIDRDQNDRLALIDYKTGAVPTQKSVALGFSPQLTLEALIAYTGGFDGIDAGDVGKLEYWKLSGGRPAGDVTEVKGDIEKRVAEARAGVTALVKTFNDPSTPYLSTPRRDWAPRYNNYEHLSRVGEWATVKKTQGRKSARKPPVRRNGQTGKGGAKP